MVKAFTGIKVLIWDFDGTFYKPDPKLWAEVRNAEYRTIMEHTGWSREKTVGEFAKVYKHIYFSATETTAKLCGISVSDAAIKMEEYFDRRDFLKRDDRLIDMFRQLRTYRHMILANGVIARHKESLRVLGVPEDTFELFVTSETVGITKPDPAGYHYILRQTKLSPSSHLMIGDRETVDLAPAHMLGMKTCLVWTLEKSEVADVTLPDVYSVAKILT